MFLLAAVFLPGECLNTMSMEMLMTNTVNIDTYPLITIQCTLCKTTEYYKRNIVKNIFCQQLFTFPRFINTKMSRQKNEHFTEHFFGVLFTLYYDYMCSETDFTQEKVNFHATTGIPNSSSYCCSSHSGWIFLK